MNHPYYCEHTQVQQDFYKQGYAAAIEDCIKEAENCPDENYGEYCHESIVRRIKALLAKRHEPKAKRGCR